jgi:hypothetical protein
MSLQSRSTGGLLLEVSMVMCVDVAGDQPTNRTSSSQSLCDCQSHLAGSQQTWVRNGRWIFLTSITSSIHARKVLLHAVNLRHGTDGFKWCSGFLSPLKIHRPRSGSNPRTLGPVASTQSDIYGKSLRIIIFLLFCRYVAFRFIGVSG